MDPRELVHVVGVRHHSPACARLCAHVIAARRPAYVLIEGPSDLNGRIAELALPHELPIAVFSYLRTARGGTTSASWSPFCAHSPEWVALHAALTVGAEVRFMDLPAWHPAFVAVENRYADRSGAAERDRAEAYIAALCRRFRLDDRDVLWDHLFELDALAGAAALEALGARLAVHFEQLRDGAPAGVRDEPREAFMLRCLAWAARGAAARGGSAERGGVVAVCGGYHRPALLAGLAAALAAPIESTFPTAPAPVAVLALTADAERPDAGAADAVAPGSATSAASAPRAGSDAHEVRYGSYLVPYSFKRLDSLSGYASGMPSPGFQALAWSAGPAEAVELALARVAARLRAAKQTVSAADLVACRATAETLARLRGHAVIARADLLDALAATLVKDALDVDVPWARRGPLQRGTDPVLVAIVAELAGDAIGKLAPGTPRPPLAADVDAELAAHDLVPGTAPRSVTLDLAAPLERARSRVLHRLRVLVVPGFEREAGPGWATDAEHHERWRLRRDIATDARLVEAAAYGATLDVAARALLEERLLASGAGADALAAVLGDAVLAGLLDFASAVLARLEPALAGEPALAAVGRALARVFAVHEHGALLGAAHDPTLARVIAAAFDRGLWLLEGLGGGAGAFASEVAAVGALRDVARAPEPLAALVSAERAVSVFVRRVADGAAPPAVRGAALGAVVSLGARAGTSGLAPHDALEAVRRTPPSEVGDLLGGLFALAREEMLSDGALVRTVDAAIVGMTDDEFFAAVPALRLAFGFFPPRERAAVADEVAALHGGTTGSALLQSGPAAADVTRGLALDAAVTALALRYGLADARDDERAREGT